jgi:hypothetical protein
MKNVESVKIRKFGTYIPVIRLVLVAFISISMVLRIFILPDTKSTFPKIPFVFRYESSVKSPKDSTFA